MHMMNLARYFEWCKHDTKLKVKHVESLKHCTLVWKGVMALEVIVLSEAK